MSAPDRAAKILGFLANRGGWHTAEDITAAVAPGANPGVIAVECRALAARGECCRTFNVRQGIAQYSAKKVST